MGILMYMTTKNIYVADADVPLFERAAELAGGMSTAVVAGLRLYVARCERERGTDMATIELEVDEGAVTVTKRFTGRQLLRYEHSEGIRTQAYRVYQTAKGQFAVHASNRPNWGALSSPGENDPVWSDPATWSGRWWSSVERTLTVFPDLAALRSGVPAELAEAVARALEQPAVEDLDI